LHEAFWRRVKVQFEQCHMERWHDYRDPRTGLAPFLPRRDSDGALRLILGIVASPVALLLLALVFFVDTVFAPVTMIRGWVNFVFIRLLLFILGFWSVEVKRADQSDVHVCNHQSYVDLLVLACYVAPAYYCTAFGDRMVVHKTLFTAFLFVAKRRLSFQESETVPLSELKSLGRVVLFIEGATTNHERVALRLDDECVRAFDALGVRYQTTLLVYGSKAVPYLGLFDQGWARHFLGVVGGSARLTIVHGAMSGDSVASKWEAEVGASGLRLVKFSWKDKVEFMEAWKLDRSKAKSK
jgi:hypothetical protein